MPRETKSTRICSIKNPMKNKTSSESSPKGVLVRPKIETHLKENQGKTKQNNKQMAKQHTKPLKRIQAYPPTHPACVKGCLVTCQMALMEYQPTLVSRKNPPKQMVQIYPFLGHPQFSARFLTFSHAFMGFFPTSSTTFLGFCRVFP